MKRISILLLLFLFIILSFGVPQVGVLYSKTSEEYYTLSSYKTILEGLENALEWGNIEYTIIDTSENKIPEGIKVLIDPSNATLKDSEIALVENFLLNGGKIIAAYESSLRFSDGKLRSNYVYGDYLNIQFKSWQSGGYNYLQLTKEGKKIFGIDKDYIRLPRGFTFVFETSNSTPLALWTKDEKGNLTNENYPVAAVVNDFGIFFGENIYLHTDISDEVKAIIVNSIKYLLNMPAGDIDFSEIEKRKLKSEIATLENLMNKESFKLTNEESEEIKAFINQVNKKIDDKISSSEINKLMKEVRIYQLKFIDSPVIQTRGIWLDHGAIEKTGSPEGLRKTIKKLHEIGFNVLIPEVVYKGVSISSKLSHFPQDEIFRNWDEDPLDVIISESRKYGMEVHAWVWVFAISSGGQFSQIMKKHPEWIEKDKFGNIFQEGYKIAWLSHSNPEARKYIMNGILEIVEKYDIDGINLDYIRYASNNMGYDEYTLKRFKEETGVDPYSIEKYSKEEVLWHMWRENLVSSFVKEFSQKAKELDKNILISADVYPSLSGGRLDKKQNWEEWIRNCYLDMVIPMNYRSGVDDLKILLDMQQKFKNMVYILSGLQMISLNNTNDLVKQIVTSMNYLNYGVVLFSLAYIDKYDMDYLKYGLFRNKAIPAHAKYEELIKGFDKEIKNRLEICKKMGISEKDYKKVLSKWDELKKINNIKEFFDETLNFMFFISDEVSHPKSSILLTDTISWMVNILRPKIYKLTAKKDFVPEKPSEMIIVENIKPLPKAVIPKSKANIDGKMEEWKNIPKLSNFLKYDNGDLFEPETYVKVMYDDSNLYVLFVCNEPELNDVKVFSGPRDTRTYLGDSVEVFILKDEENKEYYHFVIGIDGTIYDEKGYDSRWNGDVEAKVAESNNVWYVEARINLREMGIVPERDTTLKVNFNRNRWKANKPQYSGWSVTYGSYHTIERFGIIIFGE
ncbi:MAG: family 10 glycosylhydrolase [Thermosipho sp. (in: Bacteria)]|nr:family 10 glycosylhydrolase [Thermosipho sp. (in: thermotogales)]